MDSLLYKALWNDYILSMNSSFLHIIEFIWQVVCNDVKSVWNIVVGFTWIPCNITIIIVKSAKARPGSCGWQTVIIM